MTGNPTPGTTQPDPPNLADRVTFVGCLQPVDSATAAAADANTPSNARFELTKAERVDRVPRGHRRIHGDCERVEQDVSP